jgi:hypothetical protein
MSGARLRSFRLGDRSEQLVEHLLSAFAFTTRVPRQEDIGCDFFCSLISRQEPLLKAGPFFAVQAKSSTDPIVYEKEHEVAWITSQENPLLLCIADRAALAMDVYSTWNLLCGPLAKGIPPRIELIPGESRGSWPGVEHAPDGTQQIRLGIPIARISAAEVFDDAYMERVATVIGDWVALDRTNIVNRQAGMYWVLGPLTYQTGRSPYATGTQGVAFYWSRGNLQQSEVNLGRVAAAVMLILRDGLPEPERTQPLWLARTASLREVLRTHWDLFDEPVKLFLIGQSLGPGLKGHLAVVSRPVAHILMPLTPGGHRTSRAGRARGLLSSTRSLPSATRSVSPTLSTCSPETVSSPRIASRIERWEPRRVAGHPTD